MDISESIWDVFHSGKASGVPAAAPIITRFSASNSNLDKPLKSILHRAGLVPWPKLFQNMRASCETEWLNDGHPAHVVAAWIGHSVKVQRDSYAQITDGHYESFNSHPAKKAVGQKSGTLGGTVDMRTGQNSSKLSVPPGVPLLAKHEKTPKNTGFSGFQVAVEGFEPTSENISSGVHSSMGGNHGGNTEPFSDRYTRFADRLRAAGFTPVQLILISQAMSEAGLQMALGEPADR